MPISFVAHNRDGKREKAKIHGRLRKEGHCVRKCSWRKAAFIYLSSGPPRERTVGDPLVVIAICNREPSPSRLGCHNSPFFRGGGHLNSSKLCHETDQYMRVPIWGLGCHNSEWY